MKNYDIQKLEKKLEERVNEKNNNVNYNLKIINTIDISHEENNINSKEELNHKKIILIL